MVSLVVHGVLTTKSKGSRKSISGYAFREDDDDNIDEEVSSDKEIVEVKQGSSYC